MGRDGGGFGCIVVPPMHVPHLISLIAAAFTAAWALGLVTQRLGLSPIVGYLLAGVVIGPYTPGFVGDASLAGQLAEIGVILLMFGVGLHFHLSDLLRVRRVAIPGAVGQSLVACGLGVLVGLAFGMPVKAGVVFGIALAVASTVVLIRVLTDHDELDTQAGHVAVGWLVVEDLLTVVVLVLIPVLGGATTSEAGGAGSLGGSAASSMWGVVGTLGWAMVKLAVLVGLVLVAGSRVVPWVMVKVARLRSRELFTLTVLVMALAIAVGSAWAFDASMALGAFLAGMVVGQSPVSSQAAADALPLRDAFAVLFFASAGMLFDPSFLLHQPAFALAALGVVLVGKPVAALAIVGAMGYPMRTGVRVALGLAQIGEFSFIVAELGAKFGLVGEPAHHAIVAVAIVSIALNPLVFRFAGRAEAALGRWRWAARLFDRGAVETGVANSAVEGALAAGGKPLAVVIGFGPVGRAVDAAVRRAGAETVVIDLNVDTVQGLAAEGRAAIFGDGCNIEVLAAPLARARYLVITLPHAANRNGVIAAARLINPELQVYVRARYIAEEAELRQVGATAVRFEEAEVARSLARLVAAGIARDGGAGPEEAEGGSGSGEKAVRAENGSAMGG